MTKEPDLTEVMTGLRGLIKFHQELGIDSCPKVEFKGIRKEGDSHKQKERVFHTHPQAAPRHQSAVVKQQLPEAKMLPEIRQELGDCQRCKLSKSRTTLIFGEGNSNADLFIISEPPTTAEDTVGKPFCGDEYELLEKMLQAIKLNMNDVYLTNIVKCRPAEDRQPSDIEVQACKSFLLAQIASVKPAVILSFGLFSSQALLKSSQSLFQLRGKIHEIGDIPLVASYHPAFLLSQPELKKAAWQDLQKVQQLLKKTKKRQ